MESTACLPRQDITHYSPLEGESASHGREPVGAPVGEIKRRHTVKPWQAPHPLRQIQAAAEGLLWRFLRNKQHGGQHTGRHGYDGKRDAF